MEKTNDCPTVRTDVKPSTCLALLATLIVATTLAFFALPAVGQSISVAAVGPTHLDFGHQISATQSKPLTVILSNAGSDSLPVSQILLSGDFVGTHDCPNLLPPGKECSIWVSFKPTTEGPHAGQLTITDETGTHRVVLAGTGTPVLEASRK